MRIRTKKKRGGSRLSAQGRQPLGRRGLRRGVRELQPLLLFVQSFSFSFLSLSLAFISASVSFHSVLHSAGIETRSVGGADEIRASE